MRTKGRKRKQSADVQSIQTDQKRLCIAQSEMEESASNPQSSLVIMSKVQNDNTQNNSADLVLPLNTEDTNSSSQTTLRGNTELLVGTEDAEDSKDCTTYESTLAVKSKESELAGISENTGSTKSNVTEGIQVNDLPTETSKELHLTTNSHASEQLPGETVQVSIETELVQPNQSESRKQNCEELIAQKDPPLEVDKLILQNNLDQSLCDKNQAEPKNGLTDETNQNKWATDENKDCQDKAELKTEDEKEHKDVKSPELCSPSTDENNVQTSMAKNAESCETIKEICCNEEIHTDFATDSDTKKDEHRTTIINMDHFSPQNKSTLENQNSDLKKTIEEHPTFVDPDDRAKDKDCDDLNESRFTLSKEEATQKLSNSVQETDGHVYITADKTSISDGVAMKTEEFEGHLKEMDTDGDGSAFEMDVTESQLCEVPDYAVVSELEEAVDRTEELLKRKQQEDSEKMVQELLDTLIKLNDLTSKMQGEIQRVRRRMQLLQAKKGISQRLQH